MKKIFTVVMCAFLACTFASCSSEDTKEKTENVKIEIADSSTYQGQISNLYRAYETGEPAYQMATFAPEYKEYVMANFGYADEQAMSDALAEILAQSTANYEASFGEGYMLVESIKSERDLTAEELNALKEEMKTGYGRDFPIVEAKELDIEILISQGATGSQNAGEVVVSSAAAKSENKVVAGKMEDGSWYILK